MNALVSKTHHYKPYFNLATKVSKSWRCRTQPHTHPLSVRPCYTYTTLEVAVNSCETTPTALHFTCSCMHVKNRKNYEVTRNNAAALECSNKMLLTLPFH